MIKPKNQHASGSLFRNSRSFYELYRKEFSEHLNSRRFHIIYFLLLIVSIASLAAGASNISVSSDSTSFIFLKIFTTSSSSVYSFATFMAFLGPLMGITLGFDAINSERSLGTLNRLVSQPIYRDNIINAKFLAGASVVTMTVFSLGMLISGLGLILIGVPPSGEEIFRIFCYLALTSVYISFWLALSVVFSVICRHAATAAITGISIWLFSCLFMSTLAGGIADLVYPTEGLQGLMNMNSNYTLELALERISPYYLFVEAVTTIMNPSVRSIGLVSMSQISGAISGSLSAGQSLLLVWPHIVILIAITMIGFTVSYICFMRQEIRA